MGRCQQVEQLQRGRAPSPVKPQLKAEPLPSKSNQTQITSLMSIYSVSLFSLEFDTHLFCAPWLFSDRSKEGDKDFFLFLTSHLPSAWLHKCASVFRLMTSIITDKHLLIYQFCGGWQLGKWAERLLTPLRLLLQLRKYSKQNERMRKSFWSLQQDCGLHIDSFFLTFEPH